MSTTDVGRKAEQLVVDELKSKGYAVVSQNWRTKWCEIDIIVVKEKCVYFVEVKYRKNPAWGDGLDAITPKKLEQMNFASEIWVQQHAWNGDYRLMAASVQGEPPQITDIFEIE